MLAAYAPRWGGKARRYYPGNPRNPGAESPSNQGRHGLDMVRVGE